MQSRFYKILSKLSIGKDFNSKILCAIQLEYKVETFTFFSASVEDCHILQIDPQTTPHGHSLTGVSFEATSDWTVWVSPEVHQDRRGTK